MTDEHVESAFVDQNCTGEEYGIRLQVIKLLEAKRGFALLPGRWVVERSFGWMTRFRRLAKDYERLATTLVGLHFVAFARLLLHRAAPLLAQVHNTLAPRVERRLDEGSGRDRNL